MWMLHSVISRKNKTKIIIISYSADIFMAGRSSVRQAEESKSLINFNNLKVISLLYSSLTSFNFFKSYLGKMTTSFFLGVSKILISKFAHSYTTG